MSIIVAIILVALIPCLPPCTIGLSSTAPPQISPYGGTGSNIDVYEFARNDSGTFYNAKNDTTFTYPDSRFPVEYRGYQLHAEVSNLRKTEDPVPNGNFEEYAEPGNNWTLTQSDVIVDSIYNDTGGNPGYCLNVRLRNNKVNFQRNAYIDNVFDYTSAFPPDSLTLAFDIKFSANITQAGWLIIKVAILHQTNEWAWSENTSAYHPTSWQHRSFPTGTVNGSIKLRITIQKTDSNNLDVDGNVYFDNFRYVIGSYSKPSEVNLKLNGTEMSDTVGSDGEVNIYADPSNKEETPLANCWSTNQTFIFNSTYSITYDYDYSMYIKCVNSNAATTTFTVHTGENSIWEINYTIPIGRPPPNHTGYSFGLFLPSDWVCTDVKNGTGDSISSYNYNETSNFVKIGEDIATAGERFSIYSSTPNHVLQIYPQISSTAGGPWSNVSSSEYYVRGDYLRVLAKLRPIGVSGNFGNVSLYYPNGTLWTSDVSPTFDANRDELTSMTWQIPIIEEDNAGGNWQITVAFNTTTQCGMQMSTYAVFIETKGTVRQPVEGESYIWGDTILVNVTWQNNDTNAYIPDALVQIRYVDRYSQEQYVTLTSNDQGAYSTNFNTNLLSPNQTAEFYVEFYRSGYINSSYADGTHLTFNIVVLPAPTIEPFNGLLFAGIAALILLIAIGAWLAYSKGYLQRIAIPKHLAHQKNLENIASIFDDLANLSRLLVIHLIDGICIFDPLSERGIDASLMSGFLQAISAFHVDAPPFPIPEGEKPKAAPLQEIQYKDSRILIHDGLLIRSALVLRGIPSMQLRAKLEEFTIRFEKQYHSKLEHWFGKVGGFQSAMVLVEDIFQISLLFQHSVEAKVSRDVHLTGLEARLHSFALKLTEDQEFIHLHKLASAYIASTNEDRLEVLNAIYQLRQKKLLVTIQSPS